MQITLDTFDPRETLPDVGLKVLTPDNFAYFDGKRWRESVSDIVIPRPEWWSYVP